MVLIVFLNEHHRFSTYLALWVANLVDAKCERIVLALYGMSAGLVLKPYMRYTACQLVLLLQVIIRTLHHAPPHAEAQHPQREGAS